LWARILAGAWSFHSFPPVATVWQYGSRAWAGCPEPGSPVSCSSPGLRGLRPFTCSSSKAMEVPGPRVYGLCCTRRGQQCTCLGVLYYSRTCATGKGPYKVCTTEPLLVLSQCDVCAQDPCAHVLGRTACDLPFHLNPTSPSGILLPQIKNAAPWSSGHTVRWRDTGRGRGSAVDREEKEIHAKTPVRAGNDGTGRGSRG
jgi:hypothetical protein